MRLKQEKGFTLIELVLVIAILGVLAVAALPDYFTVSLDNARSNSRDAVIGSVQTGVSLYAANQLAAGNALSYPSTLDAEADATAAARTDPLFTNVLQNGVTTNWTKKDTDCYVYTGSGSAGNGNADNYQYLTAAGTFLYIAAGC